MRTSAICAVALLCAASVFGYDVAIVEDGVARASIVLPNRPSPALTDAATEIVSHIEKASGAKLRIGPATAGLNRIVLQTSPEAVEHTDGFRIRTRPGEIRLIGGSDSGAVFACYAFLEDLGFRWLVPEEDGTVIPKSKTIAYPQTDRAEMPTFTNRFFYVRTKDAALWALRNRINGFHTNEFAEAHGNLTYLPPIMRSIHSFVHIMPPERYYEPNPEYYALLSKGRAMATLRRNQLCLSNPEVIGILAKSIRDYFRDYPTAKVFSIAPNDGYGWCQCTRCRTLDQLLCKGKTWYRSPSEPVVSDRLCVFANAVAEKAVAHMPDKELYMFSYVSYCEPPETALPHPRVTHVACHYVPACYAHPINTPGCPDNERYKSYLEGWAKISPQLMVYAYTDKSQWLGLPRPVVRQMAADIRYYRSLGVRKYLAQSSARNWPQMGPLYYVTAKLLWNADADLEAIMREWNEGMYGAAAEEMMKWYDAVEEAIRDSGGHYGGGPMGEVMNVCTPGCFAGAKLHLDRALKTADSGLARQRVEKVGAQFAYGADGVDVICHNSRWADAGDPVALKQAQTAAKRMLAAKRRWGGISMGRFKEYLDSVVAFDASGVMWSGWGKIETKGGRECRNSDETGIGDNAAGWAAFNKVIFDPTKPHRVTMVVWGESNFGNLVICTKGKGKGSGQGGVWRALPREGAVSKKPEWCTIRFTVPTEMFDRETKLQRFGFGGRDSQVWAADIRVEVAE